MTKMTLLRLPTEYEIEKAGIEAHTFLNSFNKKLISGFTAEVVDKGNAVKLDGWAIFKADWFIVEK